MAKDLFDFRREFERDRDVVSALRYIHALENAIENKDIELARLRQKVQELEIKTDRRLPWLDDALNSGDGTYRP